MNEKQFKNLLKKQEQNKLSNKEKELLNTFENNLISRNKKKVFISDLHKQNVKKSIHKNINYHKIVKKNFNWLNIAASIILLISLGVGFSYYQRCFNNEPTLVVETENIILQLGNGKTQIIKEDGTTQLIDVKGNVVGRQKGSRLVYDSDVEKETLVYNTLTIPCGKRFNIQLSDGTNVHLNSGTSLKYPVKFIKGEKRQVFLKGEAYFSLAKNTEHPFMVNANKIDVRVLGTKFNAFTYDDRTFIATTLVEGSVEINNLGNTELLKPDYRSTIIRGKNEITINEVVIPIYIHLG